jgi:hypothetical protein
MKKTLILLLLPLFVFAQSFLISNIPLPKTYIMNLDPYSCDEQCLQTYVDNEMIFSFLAHAQGKLDSERLNDIRNMNIGILNVGSSVINAKIKIAMLLPYKKIGKYATSTTNATFAYLITRNQPFELKSYKIEEETPEEISLALSRIYNDGFEYVIAPLTSVGAQIVTQINPELKIFFPTINKQDIINTSETLFFGGIDYRAQSDLLLQEAVSPLVIFHDTSLIGEKLASYEDERFRYNFTPEMKMQNEFGEYIKPATKTLKPNAKTIMFSLDKTTTNLERYLKNNEDLNESSMIINTPIVKTSMVLSQITLYDINATNILSTQINYDPLILSMTQYHDRKKMLIANSITQNNNVIVATNSILSNDIEYDWINYATTIAIDYFFHHITNEEREYSVEIANNQVIYPIEIMKPAISRFVKYSPDTKEDGTVVSEDGQTLPQQMATPTILLEQTDY